MPPSTSAMTGKNAADSRIATVRPLSSTRKLATADAMPGLSASYPKTLPVTGLAEGSDPAVVGYYIPIRRNPSAAIAFQFAVAHASAALDKHAKWRFIGLRERSVPTDAGQRVFLEPVPLLEVGVFGGAIDVETNDTIRPASGVYAPGGSANLLRWADTIEIATGEQYIADDAVQIVQLEGLRAELQINTQGCAWIIAIPACIESAATGDAAAGTLAVYCDI